jgi:methyl-accepting chemotaxis protein
VSTSRRRSLRRALTVRIVAVGLAAVVGSVLLLGVQVRRQADDEARAAVAAQAARSADQLAGLFGTWRDNLLVAASDASLVDWYTRPQERDRLRPRIEALLVRLHEVYPDLIDEACYIDAGGPEVARSVRGGIALVPDLSADESGSAFFGATARAAAGTVWQNDPYVSADSGRWVVSNSTPVVVDGRTRAFLHFEANLDAVRTALAKAAAPGMQVRVVDTRTGVVVADTGSRTPILAAPLPHAGAWAGAGPVRAGAMPALGTTNANRWRVEVASPAPSPFTGRLVGVVGLAVLAAMAAVAAVASRLAAGIAGPVREVTEVAEALAGGDLGRRASVSRTDEIGRMAHAVNEAIDATAAQRDEIERSATERAAQLREQHRREEESARQLRMRTQAVVEDTSRAVLDELALVVERVEEVRSGAAGIDGRVTATGDVTRGLVEQAAAADRVVGALGESLRRVGGIADLISTIASQTNLLALNATIESARAGSAGLSFAIVAREVKELAASTATSTGEITTTIGELEREAAAVAQVIDGMAAGVSGIDAAAHDVTVLTAQQQDAVARLAAGVTEAMDRIATMAGLTGTVDRRAVTRVVVRCPAVLRTRGRDVEGEVVDLSPLGARVTRPTSLRLPAGEPVGLDLLLPAGTVSLAARVVRDADEDGAAGWGLEFTQVPDSARAAVAAFLDEVLSG